MDTICRRIAGNGGAGLIIDYGHAVPGLGDTLQCVQQHAYSDVLDDPGAKDITAHVDFSLLATFAAEHVRVHKAVPQGAFLNAVGIAHRAQDLGQKATEEQRGDIARALHRLTSMSEMGALFKVMALTQKSSTVSPAGFANEVSDDKAE
jgi:SAM-dependent MidA family methyltransferase